MTVRDLASFNALVREIRACFHDLAEAADRMHGPDGVTAAQRAVLEHVSENGPATVPDIARAKKVSRQHIQQLADSLSGSGLLAYATNPAHKRSQLVTLTADGLEAFSRIRGREGAAIAEMMSQLDPERIKEAALTLRQLRAVLSGDGAGL